MSSALSVPEGYKMTEVGVIPRDWEVTTAIQICELVVDCKNRTPPVIEGGDYAVVRTPNVRNGNFVWEDLRFTDVLSFREWTARATPQAGDILITREAPLGEVCLVPLDIPVCLGQRMMLYRPDPTKVSSSFLLYALMSPGVQGNLLKKIGGSTVGHAKVDDIRYLQVPLPSVITEQQAIAEALSDADALVESLEQLLVKKRQIKQGAMQELLTGQKRLLGFSGEWELKRLGDIAEMSSGGTPPSSNPDYYDGSVPWVSIADMTKGGKYIDSTEKNLSSLGFENCAAQMFAVGTILYAMYASLGECSIANVALSSSQAILGIRSKSNLNNEFLYYFLESIKSQVKGMGQQGTQANLNKGMVQDFRLRLPLLPEQTAIATILSTLDSDIAALQSQLVKARQIKQGMAQELLTGRIRLVSPATPHQGVPA